MFFSVPYCFSSQPISWTWPQAVWKCQRLEAATWNCIEFCGAIRFHNLENDSRTSKTPLPTEESRFLLIQWKDKRVNHQKTSKINFRKTAENSIPPGKDRFRSPLPCHWFVMASYKLPPGMRVAIAIYFHHTKNQPSRWWKAQARGFPPTNQSNTIVFS